MASKASIFVTTRYEGLDADSTVCVEFIDALKQAFTDLAKYNVVEQDDQTVDYYKILLMFVRMENWEGDPIVLSTVLAFHDGDSGGDFYLEHWAGYFTSQDLQEFVDGLVADLDGAIERRMKEGFV